MTPDRGKSGPTCPIWGTNDPFGPCARGPVTSGAATYYRRMGAGHELSRAQASLTGIALRNPPPEPTTCCGRGCNGCVWEGFLEAAEYWRQEALLQLQD